VSVAQSGAAQAAAPTASLKPHSKLAAQHSTAQTQHMFLLVAPQGVIARITSQAAPISSSQHPSCLPSCPAHAACLPRCLTIIRQAASTNNFPLLLLLLCSWGGLSLWPLPSINLLHLLMPAAAPPLRYTVARLRSRRRGSSSNRAALCCCSRSRLELGCLSI
jgi:hypothetical protein